MDQITIQDDDITIPLKLLREQPEGLAVISVGSDSYLILPTNTLRRETVQRLIEISEAIRTLQTQASTEATLPEAAYSSRKKRALKHLAEQGLSPSAPSEYGLDLHLDSDVTLEQVRQELSSIRGSLAQTVTEEREQS